VGESESLPIDDGSLDYVFANMYLHHVERPANAIREAFKKLKAGGVIVVTDLDAHKFEYLRTEHNDRWMGFERSDIAAWYEEAGFEDVKVDCVGETCDSTSSCGGGDASISIFYAIGRKK
jgi:SAM-dependent methyltransferase